MSEDAGKASGVAAVRPDSRSHPIGRTPRRYTIWCLWGKGCPICSRETTEETMAEFNPGDKVAARYGALLDADREPMVATVLHEQPPGSGRILIRYRCTDGSATDNWVRAEHLERPDS
jgi:hypothetical protein